jgi:hypothetical protein
MDLKSGEPKSHGFLGVNLEQRTRRKKEKRKKHCMCIEPLTCKVHDMQFLWMYIVRLAYLCTKLPLLFSDGDDAYQVV